MCVCREGNKGTTSPGPGHVVNKIPKPHRKEKKANFTQKIPEKILLRFKIVIEV